MLSKLRPSWLYMLLLLALLMVSIFTLVAGNSGAAVGACGGR